MWIWNAFYHQVLQLQGLAEFHLLRALLGRIMTAFRFCDHQQIIKQKEKERTCSMLQKSIFREVGSCWCYECLAPKIFYSALDEYHVPSVYYFRADHNRVGGRRRARFAFAITSRRSVLAASIVDGVAVAVIRITIVAQQQDALIHLHSWLFHVWSWLAGMNKVPVLYRPALTRSN